jgi:hypothetical protein
MNKLPFNGKCQTFSCDGEFISVENYEYKEYEPKGNHPFLVTHKETHSITAQQCNKCGRIHGEVTETTGEVIEFFTEINKSAVDFQTPSNFGKSDVVATWNKKQSRETVPA